MVDIMAVVFFILHLTEMRSLIVVTMSEVFIMIVSVAERLQKYQEQPYLLDPHLGAQHCMIII